jgi:MYXO-CTERM domain-containing protein
MGCYAQGSPDGQQQLDALLACFDEECGSVSDDQFQQCAEQNCGTQLDTCFPVITGDATCSQVYDCLVECPQGDATCQTNCYNTGTADAQAQLDAMFGCWDDQCGTLTDDEAWRQCIYASCGTQLDACFPPANCSILGGDCPTGSACFPTPTGATDCYTSNGVALGQACADTDTALACADGTICIDAGAGDLCHAFCRETVDCGGGLQCAGPIFEDVDDLGVCVTPECTDADEDGYCAEEDCDDGDASTYPDAPERCNDSVDNDCDDETNEGCATCIDDDADGYCTPDDCDDDDSAIHPTATETCNDGVDNNCNDRIDDGCVTCTDADHDGVCLPTDCDDSDRTSYPTAPERCNDSADNDCDGEVNDGCASCTDLDRDGYCAGLDCNDNDAAMSPGHAEKCDDGKDNDCDGTVDGGSGVDCSSCTDRDVDLYCDSVDCDDQNPNIAPDRAEICTDTIDNNCNGVVNENCSVPPSTWLPEIEEESGCSQTGAPATHAGLVPPLTVAALAVLRRRRR